MQLEAGGAVRFTVFALLLLAACRPPGYGRQEVDGAVDGHGGTDGSSAIDAAGDGPASCAHAFRLDGHGTAQSVWLTGDFVMWGADVGHGAIPFALGVDGGWTVTHSFGAGPHQYKFIIDGSQWITDPTNPNQIDDGFGNKNSLYTCTP
ncbi:MAG: apu [Myxococcales bacterium]|nr:apu [Myxococcales bacterium]